jgi:catecholate siderophore receptor
LFFRSDSNWEKNVRIHQSWTGIISLTFASAAYAQATSDPKVLPKVSVEADDLGEYVNPHISSATRTETALRDVPQSVTVISRALIEDQAMQSLSDVARYVPGAGMAQGEGNRDTIILRGNSSTADFFVDGVRDDVEYFRDLYNVERVEALKGPNAMIFGRGGVGGVINRVTRQADGSRVRELSLQGGSWSNARASFDVGDGLNESFSFRVTGMYEDSESFRDGVDLQRYGINPTAAIQLGDATVLRLSYEYFTYDRVADRGVPSLNGRPYEVDEGTFFGDPSLSPTDTTVNLASVVVDHRFSDSATLRNRTVYGDYDKFYQNVYPGGPANPGAGTVQLSAYNHEQLRENLFNQTDLTFTFETGRVRHRFLTGLEFGRQVTDNFRNTGFFNNAATSFQAPLAAPTVSVPVTFRRSGTEADNHGTAEIAAIFVQDQIEFSPRLQAVLGLRYDQFDVDFRDDRTGTVLETSDDLVSPRAGLIFKPTDPVSVYASYSLGYMPRAGAQLASLDVTNESLDPEEFENLEVGVKWDASESLSLTAAVFQLDRTNVVIPRPNPDPTEPQYFLAKGQTTEGIEFGASGSVGAWSVQAGYAYQDGQLTAALGGTRLAQLPEHVISLWNKYQFTPKWSAGLGLIHQTEMYAAADNLVTLPEFTRWDAGVFFTPNQRWRLQVNLQNLLDEEYYANAHNNNNISPGAPFSVRASLIVRL